MRKLVLLASTLAFGVSAFGAAENIYRNEGGGWTQFFYPALEEHGDQVTLAGTERSLKEISLSYTADLTNPQGDERGRIRIYQLDGGGLPTVLLWDSGEVAVFRGTRVLKLTIPDINVTDPDIVWTVQWTGVTGGAGDRIGVRIFQTPSIGVSDDFFWQNQAIGGWQQLFFNGNPIANFKCSIWAGGKTTASYNNSVDDLNTYVGGASNLQYGDDVSFEGDQTTITSIRILMFADIANPQGDEKVVIRIYENDGDNRGAPGTVLFTSAPQDLIPGVNDITVAVPNVASDGTIVYTVLDSGMVGAPGDEAGLLIYGVPDTGISNAFLWLFDGNPNWGTYWFGPPPAPLANFGAEITTAAPVRDVLMASFTTALGTLLSGNLASTFTIDNDRLRHASVLSLFPAFNFISRVNYVSANVGSPVNTFDISVTGRAVGALTKLLVSVRNPANGSFLQQGPNLDLTVNDQTFTITGLSNSFVAGDNTVTLRLESVQFPPALTAHIFELNQLKLIVQ